jgi:hypothetical protein
MVRVWLIVQPRFPKAANAKNRSAGSPVGTNDLAFYIAILYNMQTTE